jgi:hypothetical protein
VDISPANEAHCMSFPTGEEYARILTLGVAMIEDGYKKRSRESADI